MIKRSTVPAFTLVEVLVSMAVTAIVLAIIFVIFSIMTQRMVDYKNQNEPVAEMNRLTYAVSKALFECRNMELSEDILMLTMYSGSQCRFEFGENYILRREGQFIDTFHLPTNRIIADSVFSVNRRVMFIRLQMEPTVNANEVRLKFYKRVLADELLKMKSK